MKTGRWLCIGTALRRDLVSSDNDFRSSGGDKKRGRRGSRMGHFTHATPVPTAPIPEPLPALLLASTTS